MNVCKKSSKELGKKECKRRSKELGKKVCKKGSKELQYVHVEKSCLQKRKCGILHLDV